MKEDTSKIKKLSALIAGFKILSNKLDRTTETLSSVGVDIAGLEILFNMKELAFDAIDSYDVTGEEWFNWWVYDTKFGSKGSEIILPDGTSYQVDSFEALARLMLGYV